MRRSSGTASRIAVAASSAPIGAQGQHLDSRDECFRLVSDIGALTPIVGVEALRASAGLGTPNELGVDGHDGSRRSTHAENCSAGVQLGARRSLFELEAAPAVLLLHRSSWRPAAAASCGLGTPNDNGEQLQALAVGDCDMAPPRAVAQARARRRKVLSSTLKRLGARFSLEKERDPNRSAIEHFKVPFRRVGFGSIRVSKSDIYQVSLLTAVPLLVFGVSVSRVTHRLGFAGIGCH